MKNFFKIKRLLPLLSILLLVSCIPKKDMIYYQGIADVAKQNPNSYEIKIQPDDLLSINVSAEDPEISAPFNLNPQNVVGQSANVQSNTTSYLVDASGCIDFPVLGKLKLAGLTRTEVLSLLQTRVGNYIKQPIITVRLLNFKVSVQGEVNSPGTYSVTSDRFTLIEALAKSGDLTSLANRKNVMIIRENDGVKSIERVDLTKANFINSPYYYLAQNDVIYVEPGYTVMNPNIRSFTTIASILISITTFIIAIAK